MGKEACECYSQDSFLLKQQTPPLLSYVDNNNNNNSNDSTSMILTQDGKTKAIMNGNIATPLSRNFQRQWVSPNQMNSSTQNPQSYFCASQPNSVIQTPARSVRGEGFVTNPPPPAGRRRILFDSNIKQDDKIASSWNNDLRYSARSDIIQRTTSQGPQQIFAPNRTQQSAAAAMEVDGQRSNRLNRNIQFTESTKKNARVFPERNRPKLSPGAAENNVSNIRYFSTPELNAVVDTHEKEVRRLRRMLKDREHELVSIRETFVSNERAILQVLQDKQREWQVDSASREHDWKHSVEDHIQRSVRHDASVKRQLDKAEKEINRLQESLMFMTAERDSLNIKYRKSELEKMELENTLENRFHVRSSMSDLEQFSGSTLSNGKVGVWSIVGNQSQMDMSQVNMSQDVAFKPINGSVRQDLPAYNTSPQRRSIDSYFQNKYDNEIEDAGGEKSVQVDQAQERFTHSKIQTSSKFIIPKTSSVLFHPVLQNSTSIVIGRHSCSNSLLSQETYDDYLSKLDKINMAAEPRVFVQQHDPVENKLNVVIKQRMPPALDLFYPDHTASTGYTPLGSSATREDQIQALREHVRKTEDELEYCRKSFDVERHKWLDEKTKVIGYQTNLQQKFTQLLDRNRTLENELSRVSRLIVQLTPFHNEDAQC